MIISCADDEDDDNADDDDHADVYVWFDKTHTYIIKPSQINKQADILRPGYLF